MVSERGQARGEVAAAAGTCEKVEEGANSASATRSSVAIVDLYSVSTKSADDPALGTTLSSR